MMEAEPRGAWETAVGVQFGQGDFVFAGDAAFEPVETNHRAVFGVAQIPMIQPEPSFSASVKTGFRRDSAAERQSVPCQGAASYGGGVRARRRACESPGRAKRRHRADGLTRRRPAPESRRRAGTAAGSFHAAWCVNSN